MGKVFRPSNRESSILSKIESGKELARRQAINAIHDCLDPLSNAIAMKLIESELVETTNKNMLQEQIRSTLEQMGYADDFEIDYQVAPYRNVVSNPHIVSIFITAFVLDKLINHKDIVDIFGSDADIYNCINNQVDRFLPS